MQFELNETVNFYHDDHEGQLTGVVQKITNIGYGVFCEKKQSMFLVLPDFMEKVVNV